MYVHIVISLCTYKYIYIHMQKQGEGRFSLLDCIVENGLMRIAKELKITQILNKLLEYKRNWIQHVNKMPRNRLPRVMKRYSPTGRRNHGRTLKRLLDTWDRNGSTIGPTPWQIYDDDDDKLQLGCHPVAYIYIYMCVYIYIYSSVFQEGNK